MQGIEGEVFSLLGMLEIVYIPRDGWFVQIVLSGSFMGIFLLKSSSATTVLLYIGWLCTCNQFGHNRISSLDVICFV
ncbi:hypothetical protein HHK36_014272 [Tetracentron sinense]|uniref:Uncharacterized protein n=1 Tax=Tetracentron sinense TaxID=13715 RepID=A0A835DI50_TETSI|nr:hypothetical protein HHK36_014272 [Tetracentron sinense]